MAEQDTTTETTDSKEAAAEDTTTAGTTETTESQEGTDDDKGDEWDPERAKRKISKVNSENKALRERASTAEKKAANVDDLTEQNGSLSKANMQLEVGYDLGLPLALARRLQGSTKEEMVADAEALVDLVAPTKRPATRKPAEALRGGSEPDAEPEETDLSKLGARMFSR